MRNKNRHDVLYVFILILLSVGVIYYFPAIMALFLVFILILFYISNPKNDYFWVFFVLVIVDNPGNLFWKTTDQIIKSGPIILSFLQCFIITAVLKIIIKKRLYKNIKIFFVKASIPYFIWLAFLLIQGLYIGIEGGGATGYRYYFYYALTFIIFPIFFVMPYLIKSMTDVINIFYLISIFVIINFLSQIYNCVNGQSFHTLLGGVIPVGFDDSSVFENFRKMLRPVYFVYSSFFAFILAPFFLQIRENPFNRMYLYLVSVVAFFSIILTSVRGWMIAFTIYLVCLFFIDIFFVKRFISQKIILSVVVVAFVLLSFVPVIQKQFSLSFERLEKLSLILQGDKTGGGTNSRLTTRLYPVMEKFGERPIFGWGFSSTGMATSDGHVGNATLLMTSGIIGAAIILILLLKLFNKNYNLFKSVSSFNNYKRGIIVLSASIVILLIIHTTSSQVFGYYRYVRDGGNGALWISMYFAILNVVYQSTIEYENVLSQTETEADYAEEQPADG